MTCDLRHVLCFAASDDGGEGGGDNLDDGEGGEGGGGGTQSPEGEGGGGVWSGVDGRACACVMVMSGVNP